PTPAVKLASVGSAWAPPPLSPQWGSAPSGLFGSSFATPTPNALVGAIANSCGLVCNGANGTALSPNGQNGGLLFGNGGNGFNSTTAGVAGGNGGNGGIFGGNGGT